MTLVPFIESSGELKSKPTQHSVKELRAIGIQPDVLLCRTNRFLPKELRSKISLFCNVPEEAVITAKDVSNIYEVPLVLHEEGLDGLLVKLLSLPARHGDLSEWTRIIETAKHPVGEVHIGIVGKYVEYEDSYKSLNEALVHGGLSNHVKVRIKWIESEGIVPENCAEVLGKFDGILVPGGFGKRGIEGMLRAIRYAREAPVPYFGICLGMQCAVIEFARNVCGLDADSSEFDQSTQHRVIYKLRELLGVEEMGGTMRLGAYPCVVAPDSLAYEIYRRNEISERHRHRYEFNREYEELLVSYGLKISGNSPDGNFVEIVEMSGHPWFFGCQFHPEFKSRPLNPHPVFASFIAAAWRRRGTREISSAEGVASQEAVTKE